MVNFQHKYKEASIFTLPFNVIFPWIFLTPPLYKIHTKKTCIYWHLHNTVNGIKSLVGVEQEENTSNPIRIFDLKLFSFPFMMVSIEKQFHYHMDDAMTPCLVEQPAAIVEFQLWFLVGYPRKKFHIPN